LRKNAVIWREGITVTVAGLGLSGSNGDLFIADTDGRRVREAGASSSLGNRGTQY
jgi:hypothetical protein